MRIAVCDDEEAQRRLIIKYLHEWQSGQQLLYGQQPAPREAFHLECLQFESAEQFLFYWEDDRKFDLLILDIEMDGICGMELAARIRTQDEEIPILFITGYEKYMAQGYEVSAIQYLLKPLNNEKLFQVLERLQKGKRQEEKLVFQTEEAALVLVPSDIWYVEADRHYCILHAMPGSRYGMAARQLEHYRLRHSITEVSRMLSGGGQSAAQAAGSPSGCENFVQCHRSILVNLKHISAITRTELVMDDGTRLPVSRGAYKSVNEAFLLSYGIGKR